MRAFTLSILVTWAKFAALSLAIPVFTDITASLAPRSKFCDNVSTVVAGMTFDRRSLVSDGLAPQAPGDANTIWCAAGGSTYIAVTLTAASVSAERALYIVSQALNRINFQIANYGDGLIPMGMFIQAGKDTSKELYIANRNNHQQTWVSRALL